MSESLEHSGESLAPFAFPDIRAELGEIERVAHDFFPELEASSFVRAFTERAEHSFLEKLSEEDWAKLENSDSYDIARGDWAKVKEYAEGQEVPRDWEDCKSRLERGVRTYAPIIARKGDRLHLVSGNTRLMVARALGLAPPVLVVDMTNV